MSEFEIGDQVVLSPFSGDFAKDNGSLYDIFDFENDLETLAVLTDRKGGEVRSSTEHLRYPTKEEIAAGHRIDKQIEDIGCNHNFEEVTQYGDTNKSYMCTICEYKH